MLRAAAALDGWRHIAAAAVAPLDRLALLHGHALGQEQQRSIQIRELLVDLFMFVVGIVDIGRRYGHGGRPPCVQQAILTSVVLISKPSPARPPTVNLDISSSDFRPLLAGLSSGTPSHSMVARSLPLCACAAPGAGRLMVLLLMLRLPLLLLRRMNV